MLVLSRKVGESIYVGKDITVTVVRFSKDGRVRIGIEAPKNVRILRNEIAHNNKGD